MTYSYGIREDKEHLITYPMKYLISAEDDKSGKYTKLVTYSCPLTKQQLKKYGMKRLGGVKKTKNKA